MQNVEFDEDRCKGCELCVEACPKHIVIMAAYVNARGYHPAMVVRQDMCIACCFCARMCPDVAITVRKEERNIESSHEG